MLAFCRQRQQYWTAPFIFRLRCRETAPGGWEVGINPLGPSLSYAGASRPNPVPAHAPAKKRLQPCLYGTRQWPNL